MTQRKYCPMCREKNNGNWVFLCSSCWWKFVKWAREKYGLTNTEPLISYLPEYLKLYKNKVKVEFT